MTTLIKLKDVFDLPGEPINLAWGIRSVWIPEVDICSETVDDDAAKEMTVEGRLVIRCIFERNFDGDRFADMHTIFFDGQPIMFVRDAGRSGRDFRSRTIINQDGYSKMCYYIREKMKLDLREDDLEDPEKQVYAEEIFNFYGGSDYATELGFPVEPRTEGFLLFSRTKGLVPDCNPDHILLTARAGLPIPEYVRRDGTVLKRLRELSDEEVDKNPRMRPAGLESGFIQHWWFEHCERPENVVIVKV